MSPNHSILILNQSITFGPLLRSADEVPSLRPYSGFMMADVMLHADRILKGKLLQQAPPPPDQPARFSHELLKLLQMFTTTELHACLRINKIGADGLSPNPFHRNPGVRIDALQNRARRAGSERPTVMHAMVKPTCSKSSTWPQSRVTT